MESGGSMPHLQGFSNNPYPEPNQPNCPHWYLSLRSILILSFFLYIYLLKFWKHSYLPPPILATCPAHLNLLDLITLTILGERYELCSSSLLSLLHSPFSSLLGPNIRLREMERIHPENIFVGVNGVYNVSLTFGLFHLYLIQFQCDILH